MVSGLQLRGERFQLSFGALYFSKCFSIRSAIIRYRSNFFMFSSLYMV
nr:MAG TPA: hypothetical protein [Caudoviricetes sp.]DAQ55298.1 MAG TPA: hypothetical protein [Caudoviricetes sp.]